MHVTFSGPKAYYSDKVFEFNLPAGHSCPQASACLLKADRITGKMTHGKHQIFRCYAAMNEGFPAVRDARWSNFDLVRKSKNIVGLISSSIPKKVTRIRIHGSGDFFKQSYFDAWVQIAISNPHILFWTFTKSVQFWVNRLNEIPGNLILQASRGGKQDHLIDEYNLKSATVYKTIRLAEESGLPIDVDDKYAYSNLGNFALVDNFGPDRGGRVNTPLC